MLQMFSTAVLIAAMQVDTSALMLPVNAWVRAFNTHQAAFPSDAFTDDCTVIDEFPPFAWDPGHVTIRQWYAAVEGLNSAKNRQRVLQSKETVDVGNPENVVVKGNDAYMTFHAVWSALVPKGRHFSQTGLFAVVERKTPAGWRISANSWGILANHLTPAR